MSHHIRPKFTDILSAIPGFFGIRLEEEPKFDVVDQIDDIEIRRYREAVLARVTVPGEHDVALNAAFLKLAGYIYGENSASEKMEMTLPVSQSESDGEKMSMTTPVLQNESGDGWTVSFFLGNDMRAEDAPTPNDPTIELVEEPAATRASYRYTGINTDKSRAEAKQHLLDTLSGNSRWRVVEDVAWAQYDQPFSIPFLKRNEAHVAVEETGVR